MSLLGKTFAANSLQDGLQLHWATEQTSGTNEPDFSPNGRDGLISGATLNIDGHRGKTYSFDGVNDDIDVAYVPTGPFSVSQWIESASYQADQVSWSFSENNNDDQNISLVPFYGAGGIGLRVWWDGEFIIEVPGIALDVFQNLIFTSNGVDEHELFLNGVSVGTSTATKGFGTLTNFMVGQYGDGFFLEALIDETKIWDKVLSQADIDNEQLI